MGPTCPNCSAALREPDRFCAHCGQRVPRGRLRLRDLLGDVWHALVGVDRSLLALLRGLLVRPGVVAREWVEGRRKRWFGPFAFVLWMVGVSAAVVLLTGFTAFTAGGGGRNDVADFLQRHVNVVQALLVPVLAGFARLLFRSRNYAEQLVLAAYTMGLRVAVFALVVIPLWLVLRPSPAVGGALANVYVGLWVAYYAWATTQFLGSRAWPVVLRGAVAAAAMQYVLIGGVLAIGRIWFRLRGSA